MIMKFYELRKVDETRNPMKAESSDSDLRSERYPYFKISKNSNIIWAKMNNKTTLKVKLTS